MPFAATLQAARPAPMAVRDDARAHVTMPARPTSAHSAALEAWICALLMALIGHIEPLRQFFPTQAGYELPDDEEAAFRLIRHAIRAENRLRARVAWLVRQHPNRGMRRRFSGLTPELRAKPARAPPARRPQPEKIRSENTASGGDDSRPKPGKLLLPCLAPPCLCVSVAAFFLNARRTHLADKPDARAEADPIAGRPPLIPPAGIWP